MYDEASMYEQADAPDRDSALIRLDGELKRLHATIEDLTKRLEPVLLHHPEADSDNVKPMAESGLRQRVATLSSATGRLDRLMRDLDV